MIEIYEQGLVEQFVAHAPVGTLDEAVLHRLARDDEIPIEPAVLASGEQRLGGELGTAVAGPGLDPDLPRLPRHSYAEWRPEIDMSGMARKHSLVRSSTMLKMRKRRPSANWSWTKSIDQRALALASTGIGARVPTALRLVCRLRTDSPSSR